jgi:hypothetical protein
MSNVIQFLSAENARELSEIGKAKFREKVGIEATAMIAQLIRRIELTAGLGDTQIEHEFCVENNISRSAFDLLSDTFIANGYKVAYSTLCGKRGTINITVSWNE